jgi:hypothetical protein
MMDRNCGLAQVLPSLALASLLAATPVAAAPGDPLGGDETGCAANTSGGNSCARSANSLISKLRLGLNKCHLAQAKAAFAAGTGSAAISADEEACTDKWETYFNDKLALLAAKGCDAGMLANATARRDVILGDQTVAGSMDALNGSLFCDATSGNEIDPGGNDGGWIPSSSSHFKCSYTLGKAFADLEWKQQGCHYKLANSIFRSRTYDEAACEDAGPKSGLGKFEARMSKYIASGICPSCIDTASVNALGTSIIADNNANLEEVYVCPGP